MAEEQRTILIDIEVEDRNFDQELANVNTQLRKNREEIKELSKDYEENAEEIAKLELANKELSASKREIAKASQTEANSLNALRLRLANLTKERNNLDTSIEGNVERFNQLQKEIKSTSDEIKGFEEAGGDFRRNVGNYTDSVGEAVGETQLFGVSVNDVGNSLASTAGVIGVAVSAITSLAKAYTSSARGAEDLQRASDRLNEVYNTLGQRLADLFGGDGEEGFIEKAVTNLIGKFTDAETQARSVTARVTLEALRDSELLRLEQEVAAKEQLQRAEQLRQIRDDETINIRERIAANDELFKILSTRNKEVVDLEKDRLNNLEVLLELDEGNREIQTEILNTKLAIADINEETEGFESEALTNRISLNKELLEQEKNLLEIDRQAKEDDKLDVLGIEGDVESQLKKLEEDQFKLDEFRLEQEGKREESELLRRTELLKNQDLTELERQLIIEQSEARILSIKEDSRKKEQQQEELRNKNILQARQELTNSIINLLGQESAVGKAFALSQIIANSARGVSGAIAAGAGIPFPGNLAAIASGVSSVLAGIAQARTILSQPTPSIGGFSGGSLVASGPTESVASQVQQATIIQPQLLSQFSQPVFAQQELINATTQQPEVVNVVQVTDIVKGLNANQVVVNESSLGG